MNKPIGDAEHTLARVIRAGGLLPNEPAQPLPEVEDWAALVESARQHAVLGLLYSKLAQTGAIAQVPPDVRMTLRLAYTRALAQNTRKLDVFGQMARELTARNVPVIALKGCALATTLYDDAGQRHIGDIDFLVRREHVPVALDVLDQLGFEPHVSVHSKDPLDRGELQYTSKGNSPILVEPHWHLFTMPYFVRCISVDWFWDNTAARQMAASPALVLNDEALLVHLCSHYVVNHRAIPQLRWSYDIALLLARRGRTLNWHCVTEATKRFSLGGFVQAAIAQVQSIWDVPVDGVPLEPSRREKWLTRAMEMDTVRPVLDGLYAQSLPSFVQYWRNSLFPPQEYVRALYRDQVQGPLVHFYIRRLGNGVRRLVGLRR